MSNKKQHRDEPQVNSKGNLVLVTNHFPYGLYESFLEKELPVLVKHFEKVVVVCRDVSSSGEREIYGARIHRVNPVSGWREKVLTVWLCVINSLKVINIIKDELRWLRERKRKLNTFILDDMIHQLVKALQTAHQLCRIIKTERLTGPTVLYSYWLSSSALALTFVSSKRAHITTLSRAHGGDVYEYRNDYKYLPFRRTLIQRLDRIFAISNDAAEHLRVQVDASLGDKIQVARLGTKNAGASPAKKSKQFTVVSCAFMVAVKRIHLLIDALQQIDRLDVHWIHIGSGPLEEQLTQRAKERLGRKGNVSCQFMGSLNNNNLMKIYQDTYVDLFVNTSAAEGIPVTIMEAQSFGIPVIAPRVGGIPEIVSEQTGRLFDVDASPLTIAHLISEVLSLPPADIKALRNRALQNWKSHYNADQNFSTFIAQIEKL